MEWELKPDFTKVADSFVRTVLDEDKTQEEIESASYRYSEFLSVAWDIAARLEHEGRKMATDEDDAAEDLESDFESDNNLPDSHWSTQSIRDTISRNMKTSKVTIYIDGANLHQSAKRLGYEIDYKKFRVWLSQKYNTKEIYLFLGLIPSRAQLYTHLQLCGFKLIFKETVSFGENIKGNCDAELVLQCASDYYCKVFDTCVIVTGDGDFACLVTFLQEHNALTTIISPDQRGCSILIRKKAQKLVFLNEQYHKFSKEKAPAADASAEGSFS